MPAAIVSNIAAGITGGFKKTTFFKSVSIWNHNFLNLKIMIKLLTIKTFKFIVKISRKNSQITDSLNELTINIIN